MAAAAAGGAAFLRLGGVQTFIAGLDSVGQRFERVAVQAGAVQQGFHGATGGFQLFNAAVQEVATTVGAVSQALDTVTSPIRAIAGVVTDTVGAVVAGNTALIASLGAVAQAAVVVGGGNVIGIAGLVGSLVALGTTAVVESARFERGMKDIEGVTQTTGPALLALDSAVRRVATGFSSSIEDISRASLDLAKAGIPLDAVKTQVLDIAVALQQLSTGELSAGKAAEGIGANLKLFFKDATDPKDVEDGARRIANAVGAAANATRASIPEILNAIAKAGPGFVALGENIEQTAAAVALLTGTGLRGEEAGTALSNFIQRLEGPSREASKILQKRGISIFEEGTGAARPVIDVISNISDVYSKAAREVSGMTDEVAFNELAQIAQTRVLRSINLILNQGVESYRKYTDEIAGTDVLKQAGIQNESLSRQLEILRNNVQLAGIAFGRDFVSGLGLAVVKLNDFLSQGERAQQIAGVIGRAAASILTGSGTDQARAAVFDSPAGGDAGIGTQLFDTIQKHADEIRTKVQSLVGDAERLVTVFGGVIFPNGIVSAVDGLGDAIQGALDTAGRFTRFLTENLPQAGKGVEGLIEDFKSFATGIITIFTENNGEESFENLRVAALKFLGVVKSEAGPTIESFARLIRTIEEAAPPILAMSEVAVRVFGNITRIVIGAASGIASIAGAIAAVGVELGKLPEPPREAEETQPPFEPRRLGTLPATAFIESRVGMRFNEGVPARDFGPTDTQDPLAESTADFRTNAQQVDLIAQAYAQAGTTVGASLDTVAAAAALTAPSLRNISEENREAEKAANALVAAEKALSAQMRTLGKDAADIERAFDKSIVAATARWNDGLEQIAQATEDAFQQITTDAARGRERLTEAFNLTTQQKFLNDAFRLGQQDETRIFQQGQEDRVRSRADFQEDITRIEQRRTSDLERLESQHQESLSTIRQRGIEDEQSKRSRAFEDRMQGLTRGNERETTELTRGFEQQNQARARQRENADRTDQLNRSLSAAAPADRAKILSSFTDETARVARDRNVQDSETRITRQQQEQLTTFRQGQEDKLKQVRRTNDEDELATRRQSELEMQMFRRLLEVDMLRFRRNLEDQEFQRTRVVRALEIAEQRKDALTAQGFQRSQEGDRELFDLQGTRIPELERGIREIDTTATRALTARSSQTLRDLLRLSNTFRRDVDGAVATSSEASLRLLERLDVRGEGLKEQAPGIAAALAQAEAVLGANTILSQARIRSSGEAIKAQIQGITDAEKQKFVDLLPGLDTVSKLFGGDIGAAATVITTLQTAPQLQKLTEAIEKLTTEIQKVRPGTTIEQLNVTPENATGVISLGVISAGV